MVDVIVYNYGLSMCGLSASGRVFCWGSGLNNSFGNGSDAARDAATPIDGIDHAVVLGHGATQHVCVVDSDGRVHCWGANEHGQLGDGTSDPRRGAVMALTTGKVVDVVQGGNATCVIDEARSVSCWGSAWIVGDGDNMANETAPQPVPTLRDVQKLQMGVNYACALVRGGQMYCWGVSNPGWALFPPRSGGEMPAPNLVANIPAVKDLVLQLSDTCVLFDPSDIRCWASERIDDYRIEHPITACRGNQTYALTETALHGWLWMPESRTYEILNPYPIEAVRLACAPHPDGKTRACVVTRAAEIRCWTFGMDLTVVPGFVPAL